MRRECRERFPPSPRVSYTDIHQGTCVVYVPWCMPGSLNSGFLWSWWRGKRSRHSRRMRNPQFYVSGERSIPKTILHWPLIKGRYFADPAASDGIFFRMMTFLFQWYRIFAGGGGATDSLWQNHRAERPWCQLQVDARWVCRWCLSSTFTYVWTGHYGLTG